MSSSSYNQKTDAYEQAFTNLELPSEDFEALDIGLDDDDLQKMLVNSLELDREHWRQRPWNLEETDLLNTKFLLGEQLDDKDFIRTDNETQYKDNRIMTSVRAILTYATGQLARPDITPSKGDEIYLKGARDIEMALYQHAADNDVDEKSRATFLNLLTRKRGYLKLRFDPDQGEDGDVVTEVCNPEDIVISRFAKFLDNPDKIYHRVGCTIDQLIGRFPDKEQEIMIVYGIQRGVYTQMSKYIYYWECWFTYYEDNKPLEGVAWFVHEKKLILGKEKNPNWVYLSTPKKERQANITLMPPKPFVHFNYINTGHSFIDETCLVEQAIPMQKILNKRGQQIMDNADYVNGRWVYSKKAFDEEDARKLINKGPRTLAGVDREDVTNALINVASPALPPYVENTMLDARNEIDQIMGTPSIFKGSQPESSDTLGRDMLVNNQAGALQDDLVRAISNGMVRYYKLLLQMMRVYFTEDHWFQVKGGDGKYEFILLNGNKLDTDVKVSVEVDSTLPLDKASIRATVMQLWSEGQAIDYRTFMEDLGLPNPEIRTERYLKSHLDPFNYLKSIQETQIDSDAESDIQLLIMGKQPEERDNYSEDYFNYFNMFLASNRFSKLKDSDNKAAVRILGFIAAVQHVMMQSANLQGDILDPAGINNAPLPMPIPKTTVRINGMVDPSQSATLAGVPQPPVANQTAPQQGLPPSPGQAQAGQSAPPVVK